jgi:hypothetical protein
MQLNGGETRKTNQQGYDANVLTLFIEVEEGYVEFTKASLSREIQLVVEFN